jgi:catechol 2,3-dioxygenase-like lactoylglutathione lyase family enzyme
LNPLIHNMKLNAVFMAAALGMSAFASTALHAESNPLKLTPHHATISVADLDKESQWYASVLGFEKSNPFDSPDARGCWMVIPGYRVDLIQHKGSSRKDTQIGVLRQGWLHVVFRTPMIEEALKRLEAAGADVKAFKSDDEHLQRLILHDPEGNEVELHT